MKVHCNDFFFISSRKFKQHKEVSQQIVLEKQEWCSAMPLSKVTSVNAICIAEFSSYLSSCLFLEISMLSLPHSLLCLVSMA